MTNKGINMMKRILLLFLISIEAVIQVSGQIDQSIDDFEEKIVNPYQNYYSVSREHIYTHFNKSCYLPGDAIWFKCYIFNPKTKLPSIITRNLIVELYNPEGKLIEQKILYVDHGSTNNVFFLNSNSTGGIYTFRAYTTWMKNFTDLSETKSYISVIGAQTQDTTLNDYHKLDIQFLPESGNLLEGIVNKVGFKAIDSKGYGLKLSGEIIDDRGKSIQSFELDEFGMGSVLLNILSGEKLKCKVYLPDSKEAIFPLPEPIKQGIIAQVNQYQNEVLINVSVNNQTLSEGKSFYAMIHSNGQVIQLASIRLSPEKTHSSIRFNKSELINGVNYITIFDENFEPKAERLFYVSNTNIKGKIQTESILRKDSIVLNVQSIDTQGNPISSDMSLSILPLGTVSNNYSNSLFAEILLKSGIQGTIENPNYYLESNDYEHLSNLDNLLLTQGWRMYNWQNIKDSTRSELKYKNESNFEISGEVIKKSKRLLNKSNQVLLLSPDNKIFEMKNLDDDGKFNFTNKCFWDTSYVYINLLDENGVNLNQKVSISFNPRYEVNSTIDKTYLGNRQTRMANFSIPPDLFSGTIMIEGIQVIGKKEEPPVTSKIFQAYEAKTYTITEEDIDRYNSIADVLRQEFGVSTAQERTPRGLQTVYYMNRGLNSINLAHNVLFIVDDIPNYQSPAEYTDPLAFLSMSDVESISVNKTGYGLGSKGVDGAIIIKTRTGPVSKKPTMSVVNKLMVKGYSRPTSFYNPKYKVLPPDPNYLKYATIFWQPNLISNEKGEAVAKFTIPVGLNSVDIRIEGIADDGTIFFENKSLKLNK